MPRDLDFQACAKSLSVLANATRLRMVFALLNGPLNAKQLALLSQVGTKGVFYHLAILERAGVVSAAKLDGAVEFRLCGAWIDLEEGQQRFQLEWGQWRATLLPIRR